MDKVKVYGPRPEKGRAALCSFNVEGLHATDISTLLDQEGRCMQFTSCMLYLLSSSIGMGHDMWIASAVYLGQTKQSQEVYTCTWQAHVAVGLRTYGMSHCLHSMQMLPCTNMLLHVLAPRCFSVSCTSHNSQIRSLLHILGSLWLCVVVSSMVSQWHWFMLVVGLMYVRLAGEWHTDMGNSNSVVFCGQVWHTRHRWDWV